MQKQSMTKTGNVFSNNAGGLPQSDIDRLADKLDNLYQASYDINEEILAPQNASNQTGIPDEVLHCYNDMKDPKRL